MPACFLDDGSGARPAADVSDTVPRTEAAFPQKSFMTLALDGSEWVPVSQTVTQSAYCDLAQQLAA